MMADDLDIEAMLEAPFRKEDGKNQSPEGQEERSKRIYLDLIGCRRFNRKKRSRSRDRKRSRSRDKKRSRSRERKGSRSRDRRRSRSRERRPSRSRERGGRYKDHHKHRRRSRSKSPIRKEKSPARLPLDNLTPEERDARTVFCMQLAARIRPRDLEEFFSAVGKVGSPDQEAHHKVLLESQ
ncbi:hypothetical protein CCH79_00019182 [Gambusia affinis]|uniref:RNA-binding protein 39 n=1 Tax=Gambusia affinis TaxID=33528 RepID=A0A315US86_GAMAF|nr:hypothetical protein CCH79_00019182 [Gambusia affinis]